MAPRVCSVEECGRPVAAFGLCDPHYRHQRAGKTPGAIRPVGLPLEVRFWSKVNKDGPVPDCRPDLGACWLWTSTLSHGYGVIQTGTLASPKMVLAHRMAWEMEHGCRIPDGNEPDHLCRVTACVNPAHLEPVTHRENMLRGNTFAAREAAVTHCPQGHPYDEENTRYKNGGRKRDCRACDRIRQRIRRSNRRQPA